MNPPNELQTPKSKVFTATGDDADEYRLRSLMTGDVLRRSDGSLVVLAPHPCAIRAGVRLLDRLQMYEVVPLENSVRSDWKNEPYYRMALPELEPPAQVDFRLPIVLSAQEVETLDRVAVMERAGTNLLMQRWVHHNTRVVVKTATYDEMCTGPYAEIDLTYDALHDLVDGGMGKATAVAVVDEFLGARLDGGPNDSWRKRLENPEQHGPARRALDKHVDDLLAELPVDV